MAQAYSTVTAYVLSTRKQLQDLIAPYRYPDDDITDALNIAMYEINRIRPDIFLDLKYQRPLMKGDIGDGTPQVYGTSDIAFESDGVTYDADAGTYVPIPTKYVNPVQWYMVGWLQLFDVTDTQDQRAQAFLAKFNQHLMTLNAA